MRSIGRYLLILLTRLLLPLHYKIVIEGAYAARHFKQGIVAGIGHTSYDDPPIVMATLARFGIYPRPVVYSKMYDALRWIMPLVRGFRIESTSDGASI
ncbi:hypothetical protein FJY93_01650 [Candidatus Kaiserbacteria bacterium]|nr:hypothetical protein [Candidatus Kaiserbacteria bacterium]